MRGELADALVRDEGECIEFKAEFTATRVGRTICAFANTKGGKIYIGIRDKKVKVRRRADRIVGISNTDEVIPSIKNIASDCKPGISIRTHRIPLDKTKKKSVVIVEVVRSKPRGYLHEHQKIAYERVGNRNTPISPARRTALEKERDSFDNELCNDFKHDEHFDRRKIPSVFKNADTENPIGLVIGSHAAEMLDGDVVFRNVGVLFFAKNLSYFHPNASIQCVRFSGRDRAGKIVSKKEYNEDLVSDVEKALAFLNEHLNTAYEFPADSLKRREVLEIHPLALREAVVNAVVHRDYWEKGAYTTVMIFDDRVEVANPYYLEKADISKIRSSERINPLIADFMSRAGYVERSGRGLERMQKLTKDAGYPVQFSIDNYWWRLIFPRKEYSKKIIRNTQFNFGDRKLTPKRAARLLELLAVVAKNKFLKTKAIQEFFVNGKNISHRTLEEDLRYLRNAGLLASEGMKHDRKYMITKIYWVASETGLSPMAARVAKVLVKTSKEGGKFEPPIVTEDLEKSVSSSGEELEDALHELEKNNFVNLSLTSSNSYPTHVRACAEIFVKLDRFWMPWNGNDDAKTLSNDMISEREQEITPEQVSRQYGWSLRRVNPALQALEKMLKSFLL